MSGGVVDSTGQPIVGVCVYAGPPAGCPQPAHNASNSAGVFAIDLPSGLQWTFQFEHPLYNAVLNRNITTTGAGQTINVTMTKK